VPYSTPLTGAGGASRGIRVGAALPDPPPLTPAPGSSGGQPVRGFPPAAEPAAFGGARLLGPSRESLVRAPSGGVCGGVRPRNLGGVGHPTPCGARAWAWWGGVGWTW